MNRIGKLIATFAIFSSLIFLYACEDDEEFFDRPTITLQPTSATVLPDGTTDIAVSVTAPGGIGSLTAAVTGGGEVVVSSAPTAGETTGSGTVTYTAPSSPTTATITVSVIDQQGVPKTDVAVATIIVPDTDGPVVTGIPPAAIVTAGDTLGGSVTGPITATITAPAGVSSFEILLDGSSIATVDFDGSNTEETVPIEYPTTAADAGSVLVFTMTATDENNKTFSVNHALTVEAPQDVILASSRLGLAEYPGFNPATNTLTLTADRNWILDGFVFVNYGQRLVIDPGTVIKGYPGQGEGASALVVARGGSIVAQGAETAPIIMTGVADDLQGSIPNTENATWGGLVILGQATMNECQGGDDGTAPCVSAIEGIPAATEPRGQFGYGDEVFVGTNGELVDETGAVLTAANGTSVTFAENAAYGGMEGMNDAEIVLNYVSVRHGGSIIGADNELNGISFGAVGTGADVDYIEVWSNLDDGVEFFGGTMNMKHFVLSWMGDDFIDYDLGWDGYLQHGLLWQNSSTTTSSDPNFGEWDGGSSPDDAQPYASPVMANLSMIGDGTGFQAVAFFRDNAGGELWNSVVYNIDNPLILEDRGGVDSYERFLAGKEGGSGLARLYVSNNLFWNVNGQGEGGDVSLVFSAVANNDLDPAPDATITDVQTTFGALNQLGDPIFGVSGLNVVVPDGSGPAAAALGTLPEGGNFFDAVTYKGAFEPGVAPWFAGWTKTAEVLNP